MELIARDLAKYSGCLGLQRGTRAGTVISTVANQGVFIEDAVSLQTLASATTAERIKWTLPAVELSLRFGPTDGIKQEQLTYVGVAESTNVLIWSGRQTLDIVDEIHSIRTTKQLFGLHDLCSQSAVLLASDGSVAVLDRGALSATSSNLAPEFTPLISGLGGRKPVSRLFWSGVFEASPFQDDSGGMEEGSAVHGVLVALVSTAGQPHVAHVIALPELSVIACFALVSSVGAQPSASIAAVALDGPAAELVVAWAAPAGAAEVFRLDLSACARQSVDAESTTALPVTGLPLRRMHMGFGGETVGGGAAAMPVLALAHLGSFVAVLEAPAKWPGSPRLCMWDLTYGVAHREVALAAVARAPTAVSMIGLRRSDDGGGAAAAAVAVTLAVCIDGTAQAVSALLPTPSIALALGAQAGVARPAASGVLDAMLLLHSGLETAEWAADAAVVRAKEAVVLEAIAAARDASALDVVLASYVEALQGGHPYEGLSQSFMAAAVERLVELGGWPRLRALIGTCCVSAATSPGLLPAAIAAEQWAVVAAVLGNVVDLPEGQVYALVETVLLSARSEGLDAWAAGGGQAMAVDAAGGSDGEGAGGDDDKESGGRIVVGSDSGAETLLSLVLAVPMAPMFMQQYLRALPLPAALALLRLCLKWLRRYARRSPESLRQLRRADLPLPSQSQVLEWTAIVLDAHFAQMVLAEAAQEPVAELGALVRGELALCAEAARMAGTVAVLLERQRLPQRRASNYTIEALHW